MESADFPEDLLDNESLLNDALENVHATQAACYAALTNYSRRPFNRKITLLNETSVAAAEAIKVSAGIIGACTRNSSRWRAENIAELCLEAEAARLKTMRDVAPDGYFLDPSQTMEEVADTFENLIDEGKDAVHLGQAAYDLYCHDYSVDFSSFLEAASVSRRVRMLNIAQDTGLEIGKLAAGVALGTLAAHQIVKRSGR